MSDVALLIGGRSYTVACADGEEDHILELAAMIDERLSRMGTNLSHMEAKNLLFAALMLADEVHEAKRRQQPPADTARLAVQLDRVALALENAASTLERGLEDGQQNA